MIIPLFIETDRLLVQSPVDLNHKHVPPVTCDCEWVNASKTTTVLKKLSCLDVKHLH